MATALWFASGNKGKLREFERLLARFGFEYHVQSELGAFRQPPETGKTFLDNARIKARSLSSVKSDCWVLGEDSGLVVEGLNGTPGVYSARYAGDNASDMENNVKLLQMVRMRTHTNRAAHFVSALVIRSPQAEEFTFEGKVAGKISETMRGTEGFGYDPVFIPEGYDKTFGELGHSVKNKISHRTRAIEAAIEALAARWS